MLARNDQFSNRVIGELNKVEINASRYSCHCRIATDRSHMKSTNHCLMIKTAAKHNTVLLHYSLVRFAAPVRPPTKDPIHVPSAQIQRARHVPASGSHTLSRGVTAEMPQRPSCGEARRGQPMWRGSDAKADERKPERRDGRPTLGLVLERDASYITDKVGYELS